ncbi:hypothetical protein ACK3TF_001518 [Chlorella vulgaris]
MQRAATATVQANARPMSRIAARNCKPAHVVATHFLRKPASNGMRTPARSLEVRAALQAEPEPHRLTSAANAALTNAVAESQPTWQRLLQQLTRWTGMVVLGAAMCLSFVGAAHAARSGGRVGGSSFSRSSYSRSSGFGSSSSFSSGRGAASSGLSAWGSSGGFGSKHGAATSILSAWSSPSSGMSRGTFGSSLGGTSPVGSVQANSFFLSPFGGTDEYSFGTGNTEGYEEVVTVGKVQVGLMANARELQQDLERIADRADSDSPEGLHYILQETVLALMRNPDFCVYGWAKSKRERSAEDAETAFNNLSLQERTKFEKETRVNVAGRRGRSTLRSDKKPAAGDGNKELIVVTLIVAADGSFKLPQVDSRTTLKQALAMMGAVRADDLLAVEVLWTPEEEDDHFTVEEIAYDYPMLNTL